MSDEIRREVQRVIGDSNSGLSCPLKEKVSLFVIVALMGKVDSCKQFLWIYDGYTDDSPPVIRLLGHPEPVEAARAALADKDLLK